LNYIGKTKTKRRLKMIKRWGLRKIEVETMIGDSIMVAEIKEVIRWILEKIETEIMIGLFKLKAIIFSIMIKSKERLRRWRII
jgi:hypothetical protein